MRVAVNILVLAAVPDRLGGIVYNLGFRPAVKTPGNWWLILDDRRPGTAERRADILETLKRYGLPHQERPMRSRTSRANRAQPRRRKAAP